MADVKNVLLDVFIGRIGKSEKIAESLIDSAIRKLEPRILVEKFN